MHWNDLLWGQWPLDGLLVEFGGLAVDLGAFASLEGGLLVQARVDRRDAAWAAASGNGDALSLGATLHRVFRASEERYYKLETDHADKGVGGEEREASLLNGVALLVLMLVVRSLVVLGILLLL